MIIVFQLSAMNGNLRIIDQTLEGIREMSEMSAGQRWEHDLKIDDPEEYKRYQNRDRSY